MPDNVTTFRQFPVMVRFRLAPDGSAIIGQDHDGNFWIGLMFRRDPPTIVWRRFQEDLWVGPPKQAPKKAKGKEELEL